MYPKWIQRSPELGPILATSEAEEKAHIAHWKQVEKEAAKRATAAGAEDEQA